MISIILFSIFFVGILALVFMAARIIVGKINESCQEIELYDNYEIIDQNNNL